MMELHMNKLWQVFWYHHPTPAFTLGFFYVTSSLIYPKIQGRIRPGTTGEHRLRIGLYTLIILLTGYYGQTESNSLQNGSIKIGELEVPGAFFWFVEFAFTLALVKITITLLSLNLHEGLLPDSIRKVDVERRDQILTVEFQVNQHFAIVAADANREESRQRLRATRIFFENDDTDFVGNALKSFMTNAEKQLMKDNVEMTCEVFSLREVRNNESDFQQMPRGVRAAAKEAVRQWDRTDIVTQTIEEYHIDVEKSQTTLAVVLPVRGVHVVLVSWAQQIIPLGSYENLLLSFQRLIGASEIWDATRVFYEIKAIKGTDQAVYDYVDEVLGGSAS